MLHFFVVLSNQLIVYAIEWYLICWCHSQRLKTWISHWHIEFQFCSTKVSHLQCKCLKPAFFAAENRLMDAITVRSKCIWIAASFMKWMESINATWTNHKCSWTILGGKTLINVNNKWVCACECLFSVFILDRGPITNVNVLC